jgi:hypothetical protein
MEAALIAFNAPLPPESLLVTDEMVAAYCKSLGIKYRPNSDELKAIEAAIRKSPIVKAAQCWRNTKFGLSRTISESKLFDVLEEARL